jgi:glycosyltransferase involved in cell wall biosynthesis
MTYANTEAQPLISIVIPCFNEDGNIQKLASTLNSVLQGCKFEVLFVDDGSSDQTLLRLKDLHTKQPNMRYLSFSRNFGHQAALRAGIQHALGAAVISMDADLQHPPELIPQMLETWRQGADIVSALRSPTTQETWFKKTTSKFYYRFLNQLGGLHIREGSSDFRLIDRKVADVIRHNPDLDLFLRGFVSWMGFRHSYINYSPAARFSGETKYSLKKMFQLALSGLTSFSVVPLIMATYLGLLSSVGAFVYFIYALYVRLITHQVIEGWTSVIISILFIGGMILFILGIMGQYLGKMFFQIKGRPAYIIREKTDVSNS